MTAKWNLFVDVEKCTGCRNCFIAVKDEYVGNAEPGYFAPQPVSDATWFAVDHLERGEMPFTEVTYLPRTCRHCDDAPCLKASTGGAVEKRADGIVVIHPEKARGQKAIVEACPYGAALWNDELQIPQAWPFDAHLLDGGWSRPRVVQACPTGALTSAKLEDRARDAKLAAEGWEALEPDGTRPRVHYRGLHRLRTVFVAGSVEIELNGVRDCLDGAPVALLRDGAVVATTRTDAFGDFRLDRLAPGGTGMVRIGPEGGTALEIAVDLTASRSVGRHLATF
jgi:Fe-S-cluster-containing dehydrogenase component